MLYTILPLIHPQASRVILFENIVGIQFCSSVTGTPVQDMYKILV